MDVKWKNLLDFNSIYVICKRVCLNGRSKNANVYVWMVDPKIFAPFHLRFSFWKSVYPESK